MLRGIWLRMKYLSPVPQKKRNLLSINVELDIEEESQEEPVAEVTEKPIIDFEEPNSEEPALEDRILLTLLEDWEQDSDDPVQQVAALRQEAAPQVTRQVTSIQTQLPCLEYWNQTRKYHSFIVEHLTLSQLSLTQRQKSALLF